MCTQMHIMSRNNPQKVGNRIDDSRKDKAENLRYLTLVLMAREDLPKPAHYFLLSHTRPLTPLHKVA